MALTRHRVTCGSKPGVGGIFSCFGTYRAARKQDVVGQRTDGEVILKVFLIYIESCFNVATIDGIQPMTTREAMCGP